MSLKTQILSYAIQTVLKVLTEEKAKEVLDDLLDKLENAIADSATKVDDVTVLPVLQKLREIFDIPDGDD